MKKIILILGIVLSVTGCSNNRNSSENANIKAPTTQINDLIKKNGSNVENDTNTSQAKFIELKRNGYYVMDKKDNKILLVSTEKKDFSSTGGVNEYYDAIWLSGFQGEIKIGQQVQFEVDAVLNSYPGQAEAKKVSVVPIPKPEASKLSVEEVLKRALTSNEVDRNNVIVITSIKYYEESEVWQVDLKETMGERRFKIRVYDN